MGAIQYTFPKCIVEGEDSIRSEKGTNSHANTIHRDCKYTVYPISFYQEYSILKETGYSCGSAAEPAPKKIKTDDEEWNTGLWGRYRES